MTGSVIGPARYQGFTRAIEGDNDEPAQNIEIRTVEITRAIRDGISFCDADHVLIDTFSIEHSDTTNLGSDLPEGIGFGRKGCGISGSHITIRNGTVSGFRMGVEAGVYTNGDGISTEAGYNNVTIQNVTSSGNADGGFDLKSTNTMLDGTVASGNGRNYRLWATGRASTITSKDARAEDIWLGADTTAWHIGKLIVIRDGKNDAPLIYSDHAGAQLTIESCELHGVPNGTPIIKGHARLNLGPGCQPGAAPASLRR